MTIASTSDTDAACQVHAQWNAGSDSAHRYRVTQVEGEHMSKSAAQRQAEYRSRRPMAGDNGERRLNLWLSTAASMALRRLARRYGVTQQSMIERLIIAEDDAVLSTIDFDSAEWNKYLGLPPVTP